jgi:hypothetical protein
MDSNTNMPGRLEMQLIAQLAENFVIHSQLGGKI